MNMFLDFFPEFPNREPDEVQEFISEDGLYKTVHEIWYNDGDQGYQKRVTRVAIPNERLKTQMDLQDAVASENYELAALLRDKLKDFSEISTVEKDLEKALEEQNYEFAAILRDKLDRLRKGENDE